MVVNELGVCEERGAAAETQRERKVAAELGVFDFGGGRLEVVKRSPVVVGREGDIRLEEDSVSRKHVELKREANGFTAMDLGSVNGTKVDGVELGAKIAARVRWGAEVSLGEKVRFRVLPPSEPESDEPKTAEMPPPRFERKPDDGSAGVETTIALEAKETPQKRRGRRPGLTLSQRDLDVLGWIAEHRWSTQGLLLEAFFANPNPLKVSAGRKPSGKYGRERLWALEREGYIQPSRYRVGTTVPLLLSPRGYSLLHGQGMVEWAHPFPDIDVARFEHEILIQRLRVMLERMGAREWKTERMLSQLNRSEGLPYVPDAKFEIGGYWYALEAERTLKAKKRLHEFLGQRAKANKRTRMLYVLPERLLSPFAKAIKDSFSQFTPGLFVLVQEEFPHGGKPLLVRCLNSGWATMPLSDLLAGQHEPAEAKRLQEQAKEEAAAKKKREAFAAEKAKMRPLIEEMVLDWRAQRNAFIEVLGANRAGEGKLIHRKKSLPKFEYPKHWREVMAWADKARQLDSVGEIDAFKDWVEKVIRQLNWAVENGGELQESLLKSAASQGLLEWANVNKAMG